LSYDNFEIDFVLEELRSQCGDTEFGYRMQALFGHVLMRLGYKVLEIKAQGHPDIRACVEDRELLVQVKTVAHRTAHSLIELSNEDVAGITAMGRRGGWFAVLDCAVPVQWIIVVGTSAATLLGKPLYLATLRANRDPEKSAECNEHFFEMIAANRSRLPNLRYTVLRSRALAHDRL
jgi:hypothetical protein